MYVRMADIPVTINEELVAWARSPVVRRLYESLRRPRNHREMIRITQMSLYTTGRVLEIGSGSGDLAIACAMAGREVYALDVDPIAVEVGRAKVSELGLTTCRFRLADGQRTGLPDSSFDTVLLAEVLEHVSDPYPLLCEARRLVKDGGRILISVPNEYAIPDWDHRRLWTKVELECVIREVFQKEPIWLEGIPNDWLACGIAIDDKGSPSKDCDVRAFFLPPIQTGDPRSELPKVSVIIPTYNRASFLRESIDSWLQQTYENIEIIIVDDGSSDQTPEIINRYVAAYPSVIKSLRQHNQGKAAAVNAALEYVSGKYTVIFDDDDVVLPRRLEVQISFLEANPDIDMVYSSAVVFTGDPPRVVTWFPAYPVSSDMLLAQECMGNVFHGATVTLKTSALRRIGGMDSALVRAQDYDAWLRLIMSGHQVAPLNVWVAMQRLHPGLRGTAAVPVPYREVLQRTSMDERGIFRKLYPALKLEVLVPDLQRLRHPSVEAEALLLRALAMARRGLLDEVDMDLDAVLKAIARGASLTPRQLRILDELRKTLVSGREKSPRVMPVVGRIEEILSLGTRTSE
ncbi:glycosyltransferase [Geochorda subterranea]|uniref:Glycosyltransferase n=1 Tax=Geochorda subterranea TaxID=3109564 RepID=A0ABZ1BSH4_9FIRM|nr:glycosyltransferase [Limnochorda sp. LNt]WRP15777.1 glycosyltransferase [Limnochorda sp. LNt]